MVVVVCVTDMYTQPLGILTESLTDAGMQLTHQAHASFPTMEPCS